MRAPFLEKKGRLLMKQRIKIAVLTLLFSVVLTACGTDKTIYVETLEETEQQTETGWEQEERSSEDCYVYVCGAVKNPGVYLFTSSARICDAIEAAGGFTEDAAVTSVNQAEKMTDGQMLEILTETEYQAQREENEQEAQEEETDGRIDLNHASMEELMTLPGIGQTKAAGIIAYREKTGGFSSVEEVMQVEGIKEGVFNRMKDNIKVK